MRNTCLKTPASSAKTSAVSKLNSTTSGSTSATGSMPVHSSPCVPPGFSCECPPVSEETGSVLIVQRSDIAYYGINLNQSIILTRIGYAKGATPYETLWNLAVGNIIVQCAGYVPGYYVGIFLPDRIGRIPQQAGSSIIVASLYAIWAGVSDRTSTGGLITLFALSQFFLNLGPNCTTWLLPVEVFPTRVRGSAHGIAAASGKAGAVFTAFAFGTITDHIGLRGVLGLFSGIMFLVAAVTFMIPETRGRTIEEIEFGVLYGGVGPSNGTPRSGGESPVLEAEWTKEGSEAKVKQAYV